MVPHGTPVALIQLNGLLVLIMEKELLTFGHQKTEEKVKVLVGVE